MAGKRRAQNQAGQAQAEDDQNARISDLEQQQASAQAPPPAAAPAAAGGSGPGSLSDQLKQLSALHEAGALNDSEFAAAKQKLLGI